MRSFLISAVLALGADSRYSTLKHARLAAVNESKSAAGIDGNYTQDASPPNKSDGHTHMDRARIGDLSALLTLRREEPEEEKKNESADDRLWKNYSTDSNPPNKSDGHKHMDRDRIGDSSFLSKAVHHEEPEAEKKEKKPEGSKVGDNDANFTQDSNPPNKSDGHTHMDRDRIGDPSLLSKAVHHEEPEAETKEKKPEGSKVGDNDANFTQDSNPPNKSDGHTHMDRDRIGDPSLLSTSVHREEPEADEKEKKPEGSKVGDNDANFTQDANPPNKSNGHTHMDRNRIGNQSLLLRSVRRAEPEEEKEATTEEKSSLVAQDANLARDANPPNTSNVHTHMDRNRIGDPSLLLRSMRRAEPKEEKEATTEEKSSLDAQDANLTRDANPPNKSDGHTHMDRNRIGDPSLLAKDNAHVLRTA